MGIVELKNGKLRPYEPPLMTILRFWDALLGLLSLVGLSIYLQKEVPHILEASLLIFFLTMIYFHGVGLYRSWRFASIWHEITQIVAGCLILYSSVLILGYFLKIYHEFPRTMVISWMVIWPTIMSLERVVIRIFLRQYRKRGHNIRRAVIAGAGIMGERVARVITKNPWSGTRLLGFFDDTIKTPVAGYPVLGKLHSLPEYAKYQHLDIVYLTLSPQTEQKIQSLLKELADSMVSVYFVPDIFLLDLMLGGSIIFFENLPVISFRETPIRGINAFLKRIEDLVVAGFILLIASPLLLAIAVGVKLTSQGPVIFKQWRYGLNGRPIQVYKFRTMNVNEDGYDFTQATKDDSRITPFGAFLRQTSLDELPQLINVIQGRMSLVGPRPHPVAMNEQYRKSVPGYMLRHKVKPGLTGLAQIKGFRGETDTLEKIERRVEYDLEYLRQWSLVMDLEILLRTILTGAWRTNAY